MLGEYYSAKIIKNKVIDGKIRSSNNQMLGNIMIKKIDGNHKIILICDGESIMIESKSFMQFLRNYISGYSNEKDFE